MRLKNVNKLAKSKIRRYKRRTLLMIIPMSLFFGVIMALLLVLSSLKATAFREADRANPISYVSANVKEDEFYDFKRDVMLSGGEVLQGKSGIANTEGTIITRNHAYKDIYDGANNLGIYPDGVVDEYVIEEYSDDQVPILVTIGAASELMNMKLDIKSTASFLDTYKKAIGYAFSLDICRQAYDENGIPIDLDDANGIECFDSINYKIVGIIPDYKARRGDPPENFFDSILNGIGGGGDVRSFVLAGKTTEFIDKYGDYGSNGRNGYGTLIAKFSDYSNLVKLYNISDCEKSVNCRNYHIQEYFGNRLSIDAEFNGLRTLFTGAIITLIIIAMIAFATNITKIIDDEATLINLYKLVGASSGDIASVYFCYVAKVVLYTIISSIVLSLVIATVLFVLGNNTLLTGFSYMYSSSASPESVTSIKYAIDCNYIYVLVSIVLAGLVGYLCSAKKLRNMSITTS